MDIPMDKPENSWKILVLIHGKVIQTSGIIPYFFEWKGDV